MSYPDYPADSEHHYIWLMIQDTYLMEMETEAAPLYKAENEAWQSKSDSLYEVAHRRRVNIANLIQERRWRREEILQRLYLDTELRKEGKSYADVVERSSTKKAQ